MSNWKCTICGTVLADEAPPEVCPYCGTPMEQFTPTEEKPLAPKPRAI